MDNCSTNKNNYAFQFFYYIVHTLKLIDEILICTLIPGHTKFSPDRWFGVVKNAYKNGGNVENYTDFVNLINEKGLDKKHFTSSIKFAGQDAVPIYDFKDKLYKKFNKVSSSLRFFDKHYYKINKKYTGFEYKEHSFSE